MKRLSTVRGFSLLEVILAVGLFAGSVAVIIGLLGAFSRQAGDAAGVAMAQRLPDAIKLELVRVAGNDLDSLASRIPAMTAPLDNGFPLVGGRETSGVQSLAYRAPANPMPVDAQYFLVECWRFPSEPLRFDGGRAFLALHVRVSWPYRVPGLSNPVPLAERSQLAFTVSLNR